MPGQADHNKRQIAGQPGIWVAHGPNLTARPGLSQGLSRLSHRPVSSPAYAAHLVDTPAPQPPPLPAALLNPWPVVVAGTVLWLIANVLAFTVPAFEGWRPITVAGLGTGALGTTIVLLQVRAARRGSRGAQTGL